MTTSASVSVIVPCYNQGHFLTDALASLQAQTDTRWEAIIINDGSTDDTAVVAQRYAEQDKRFKYIQQSNQGLAAARNRGLRAVTGTYIQFLDADDVIAPGKFEFQIAALGTSHGPALAFCDFVRCPDNDIHKRLAMNKFGRPRFRMSRPIEDIAARWETSFSIPIHCFLFSTDLFRPQGIFFDEALPNHEDWDCWMRIFALTPQVVYVPGELAVYRFHPSSMSRDIGKMRSGFRMAIEAQLRRCRSDPILCRILERKRAEMDAHYFKATLAQRLARWEDWLHWRLVQGIRRILGIDT